MYTLYIYGSGGRSKGLKLKINNNKNNWSCLKLIKLNCKININITCLKSQFFCPTFSGSFNLTFVK